MQGLLDSVRPRRCGPAVLPTSTNEHPRPHTDGGDPSDCVLDAGVAGPARHEGRLHRRARRGRAARRTRRRQPHIADVVVRGRRRHSPPGRGRQTNDVDNVNTLRRSPSKGSTPSHRGRRTAVGPVPVASLSPERQATSTRIGGPRDPVHSSPPTSWPCAAAWLAARPPGAATAGWRSCWSRPPYSTRGGGPPCSPLTSTACSPTGLPSVATPRGSRPPSSPGRDRLAALERDRRRTTRRGAF